MLCAFRVRLAGLMEWKGKKDETIDPVQRTFRSCRRSHTPAEGVAAGQEPQIRSGLVRGRDCRTDSAGADILGVASAATLGIREIVSKCGDALVSHTLRDRLEGRVAHVRTCPVTQND